jgi:hypothetical protein
MMAACRTEGCAANGVEIVGLELIPVEYLPVTCGVCGKPIQESAPPDPS